jgi:HNH endonuclease
MNTQVQIKSEQRERLKRDWSIFREHCHAKDRAVIANRRTFLETNVPIEDDYLIELWSSVSILTPPEEKLANLRKMALLQLESLTDKQLKRRRKRFDKKKRGYLRLKEAECFVCGNPRHLDRHHVIQIKNGGSNQPLNLIALCIPCHEKIHPWMAQ